MISLLKKIFGVKEEPTIRFKSYIGNFSVATPVVPAAEVKAPWMKKQSSNKPDEKFLKCPGMFDYSRTGYIITAYTDIHIKANKAGIVFKIEPPHLSPQEHKMMQPSPFNPKLVEGCAPVDDTVAKVVYKIPLPWSIYTKKGYSAYLMPALMHGSYTDKLFVYPGVVDYDDFHTINFVFSPLKECEFVIPAGTPLLHVIPFKREDMTAECGRATQEEIDRHFFGMPSRAIKNYYRRFLSQRKVFKMDCPFKHRGQ